MPVDPVRFDGFVPGQSPIDAYGNGGFRFAGMSHKGSILCLADGVHVWAVAADTPPGDDALLAVLTRLSPPQFLLLGTGCRQVFASPAVTKAFHAAGIGLDVMDTGAACRTYNVLLSEKRAVTAALVSVA